MSRGLIDCYRDLQFFEKVNVSVDNVNTVINNVTSIVSSANETSDQNRDNLEVVANVLTQSVNVIQTQNVSLEVVSQVSTIVLVNCFKTSTPLKIIGYNRCCGNTGQR